MQRSIFFALPCHSGDIKAATFTSMIQSITDLTNLGMSVNVQCWVGDSLLPHARNVLIAKFMATTCTDMVFIDCDMAWNSEAMRRLLSHDADFVAAAYRLKNDEENYPVRFLAGDTELTIVNPATGEPAEKGCIKVGDVPMGFAKITRVGMEKLIATNADKTYTHPSAKELKCHLLFDLEYVKGEYWGEDFVFCEKWRHAGMDIWVDPDIRIIHVGTKLYDGDFDRWLRTRNEPKPQMVDIAKVRAIFDHPDYARLVAEANGEILDEPSHMSAA